MAKPTLIYKQDKWNMIQAELKGSTIIISEISSEWGEEAHVFQSRPAMMEWVHERFSAERFDGGESLRRQIIQQFKEL